MKDYKLSEVKEICKANKNCNNCEFYIKDNYKCMITKSAPYRYEIDEEKQKRKNEPIKLDSSVVKTSVTYETFFGEKEVF